MFCPECLEWQNVRRVVLKLFITIKMGILLLHRRQNVTWENPIRSFDFISASHNKIWFTNLLWCACFRKIEFQHFNGGFMISKPLDIL